MGDWRFGIGDGGYGMKTCFFRHIERSEMSLKKFQRELQAIAKFNFKRQNEKFESISNHQ